MENLSFDPSQVNNICSAIKIVYVLISLYINQIIKPQSYTDFSILFFCEKQKLHYHSQFQTTIIYYTLPYSLYFILVVKCEYRYFK